MKGFTLRPERLNQLAKTWQGRQILVVGDLMLDEYIVGVAERISPEAPVPIILCENRAYGAGGAANTAMNLQSLGAKVCLCGVVGDDWAGKKLCSLLNEAKIDTTGILIDQSRPTTLKTRIIAHYQQVTRVDVESRNPLNSSLETSLRGMVKELGRECSAVVTSDYAKGLVTSSLCSGLRELKENTMLVAGPKPSNISIFFGFDYLSLNRSEALSSADGAIDILEAGKKLTDRLKIKGLTVTLGEDGCLLFNNKGQVTKIDALRVSVYDVAGAGDTFLAGLALALTATENFVEAAQAATVAAAAVVRKVGVASVTCDEMLHLLQQLE